MQGEGVRGTDGGVARGAVQFGFGAFEFGDPLLGGALRFHWAVRPQNSLIKCGEFALGRTIKLGVAQAGLPAVTQTRI